MKQFINALSFASIHHSGQFRKSSGAPYVNHLIEVATLLVKHGITDEDILAAAVLHDIIEDKEVSVEELISRFGEPIAGVVIELTDDKTLTKEDRKKAVVNLISSRSLGARLVKTADLISNVSAIPEQWDDIRKQHYVQWVYEISKRLGAVNLGLINELEEKINAEMKSYDGLALKNDKAE